MKKSQEQFMRREEAKGRFREVMNRYILEDENEIKSRIEYLAKELGVSVRMIYAYWGGEKFPSLEKYFQLLSILNS